MVHQVKQGRQYPFKIELNNGDRMKGFSLGLC